MEIMGMVGGAGSILGLGCTRDGDGGRAGLLSKALNKSYNGYDDEIDKELEGCGRIIR